MKHLIISALIVTGISLGQVPIGGGGNNGGGGGSVTPSASAYNSSTQVIAANTNTALTFNTNLWDTCSSCTIHSTSVNPTRFTAPSAGYYLFICGVQANAAAVSFVLFFQVNGVSPTPTNVANATAQSAEFTGIVLSQILHLNALDYVECFTASNAGFTSNANAVSMSFTKLSTNF